MVGNNSCSGAFSIQNSFPNDYDLMPHEFKLLIQIMFIVATNKMQVKEKLY